MVKAALVAARDLVIGGGSGALVTIVTGTDAGMRALTDRSGSVVASDGQAAVIEGHRSQIAAMIDAEDTGVIAAGDLRLFVEALVPDPRLLLFGAGPIGEALCELAVIAGFLVEVADPRPAFAVAERFPRAASVRCAWPEEVVASAEIDDRTYVVSLLHEARFEAALLPAVLRSPARYVGALGSRRTHAARVERLHAEGFTEEDTARIHGPVGLGIGAVTPAEIAVSIVAQMVEQRRSA